MIPKLPACDSGGLPDAVTIRFGGFEPLRCAMPIPLRADYDAAWLRVVFAA